MENTEDNSNPDEIETQKKLLEENLKALNEGNETSETKKKISKNDSEDFDDYYDIKDDEEPEMKLEKGQTLEQKENESEEYF